jgi:hypothetical protein
VALASRWSELVGRPLSAPLRLPLDRGELRFVAGEAGETAIQRIELKVRGPEAAMERARRGGLDVSDEGVLIGGVRFTAVG